MVDTHAHIHFSEYDDQLAEVFKNAKVAGVDRIVTVGVDEGDSEDAVRFARRFDKVWATVGLHPHEAKRGAGALKKVAKLADDPQVVAIGECGLDYYRNLSNRDQQIEAFRFQIELALKLNKPLVFHVRDAFDDFFEIIDGYQGVRGIVHSFTSNRQNMEKAVERGFYIAFNGIMTFTKDADQLAAAKSVPLERMVLETDCPFLTPVPKRGQMNEPANVQLVAKFLSELRGESGIELAEATSKNAIEILGLN